MASYEINVVYKRNYSEKIEIPQLGSQHMTDLFIFQNLVLCSK